MKGVGLAGDEGVDGLREAGGGLGNTAEQTGGLLVRLPWGRVDGEGEGMEEWLNNVREMITIIGLGPVLTACLD